MSRQLTERALDRAQEQAADDMTAGHEVALIIDGALEDSWTLDLEPYRIRKLAVRLLRSVAHEELCGMPGVQVSITHVYVGDDMIEASGYLDYPCGVFTSEETNRKPFTFSDERGFA